MYTTQDLAGKTVEELIKIIIEQQSAVSAKDAELKSKQDELNLTTDINNELNSKVEELSKNAPASTEKKSHSGISKETFTVNNKKYGFKKPRINHSNQVITADEILASKELQEQLVKIGSGMIYEVAVD